MVRRKGSESHFAMCYWFIQVLIVFSLIAVMIWLSTRPRSPEFTITSVYVPSMANHNLSKVQQNHTKAQNNSLVFVLKITNPNKRMTICYVDIIMKLHKGGFLMGSKPVEAFCQGRKKTITEEVLIDVDDQELRRVNAGGGEGLRVRVETSIKYHIFTWTKIHHIRFEGFVRIGTQGNVTKNTYLHKIH
uniref:uncharacterized protein LOC122592266 n=1 Tax=Erigeron canadensis TaxID=72917 RepID=UPI001CB88BB0|nr:uncharacterized protein LOC122592266 [Erigeron canadensis]